MSQTIVVGATIIDQPAREHRDRPQIVIGRRRAAPVATQLAQELVDDVDAVLVGPLSHLFLLEWNRVLLPILRRVAVIGHGPRPRRFETLPVGVCLPLICHGDLLVNGLGKREALPRGVEKETATLSGQRVAST